MGGANSRNIALWSYLQGMETRVDLPAFPFAGPSFDPTYKGWKLEKFPRGTHGNITALILPTRDGNQSGEIVQVSTGKYALILPTRDGNYTKM